MIIEINNRTKHKIDLNLVKRLIRAFFRRYKIKSKEISIAFVSDLEIKRLNLAWRGKNQPTDVLAFPGDSEFFGEIIIDYNQIKRQAGKFSSSAKEELIFILVHGLLHLIGYTDENAKTRHKMIEVGEEFVKNCKF